MSTGETDLRKSAGKLVSAIQKELTDEFGEPYTDSNDEVLRLSLELLVDSAVEIKSILKNRTIKQFLGWMWVDTHPSVHKFIYELEELIEE